MNARSRISLIVVGLLCSSSWAAEKTPPHLALWKSLAGRWRFEGNTDGSKGTVRWQVRAKGSSLWGSFQDDKGNRATEIAGWRPDTKTMVVNGFGSANDHWHLELDKVTPVLITGKTTGVLASGLSFTGDFSGRLVNKDRYEVNVKRTNKEGKTSHVKITFSRIKRGELLVKCPWEWMLGHWKLKRSDGSSANVHWTKPREDADYLIGKW